MFEKMGGNVPGGNFLGGNNTGGGGGGFPGGNFPDTFRFDTAEFRFFSSFIIINVLNMIAHKKVESF